MTDHWDNGSQIIYFMLRWGESCETKLSHFLKLLSDHLRNTNFPITLDVKYKMTEIRMFLIQYDKALMVENCTFILTIFVVLRFI